MNKPILFPIILLIIASLFTGGCTALSTSTTTAATQTTPTINTTPADIKVTSLNTIPIVAEPGMPVTIEVKITNTGGTEGSHTLGLTVNGVEEEAKNVTISPRASETVTFTLVNDSSGLYEIEVAGLIETLRVKQLGAYPRLANYYTTWKPISFSEARHLATWDLIVVEYRSMSSSGESIKLIKKLNPNAKVLAWISAGLCLPGYDLWEESWLLHQPDNPQNPKPPEERRIILWTDKTGYTKCVGYNPASEWSTYLPNYVHDELMSSGLFDGVFYDCVWETMWKSNTDIDNDGVADSPGVVIREYQKGMTQLLKLTRELLGPEAIIFGNPGVEWSDNSPYWDYANGHMQENALGVQFGSHWPEIWNIYQRNMLKPSPPSRIHWIAVDTNQEDFDNIMPALQSVELRKMRFGLAITLLGDGYFGFDEGDGLHGQLWWFPEYDANLGLALGDAQIRSDGVWSREFENGVAFVNPTSSVKTIDFVDTYKDVTTGEIGTSFSVQSCDGRIFLKIE